MVRRLCGRPSWLFVGALVASLAVSAPAFAQTNGMIKGTVVDAQGQPVDGAKIVMENVGGTGRKFETRTDKKGEYIQLGLPSGNYRVTAEKDKLGSEPKGVTVRANSQQTANLVLSVATAAAVKEAQAKNAAIAKVFDEGVALTNSGQHAEAIAKFNEAITIFPQCYNCYNNIAVSYAAQKDFAAAETAYKKSIEVNPDDAAAYVGLATLYFNNNIPGKMAEAKPLAAKAAEVDPGSADAHFLAGMTVVAENPAEAKNHFEAYLRLAPNGPQAPMAKTLVTEIDKQLK
ncbi:MAG: carboxypeptidase regulatory-like domain-containing protein [Vicinamibacterales bacterium]